MFSSCLTVSLKTLTSKQFNIDWAECFRFRDPNSSLQPALLNSQTLHFSCSFPNLTSLHCVDCVFSWFADSTVLYLLYLLSRNLKVN